MGEIRNIRIIVILFSGALILYFSHQYLYPRNTYITDTLYTAGDSGSPYVALDFIKEALEKYKNNYGTYPSTLNFYNLKELKKYLNPYERKKILNCFSNDKIKSYITDRGSYKISGDRKYYNDTIMGSGGDTSCLFEKGFDRKDPHLHFLFLFCVFVEAKNIGAVENVSEPQYCEEIPSSGSNMPTYCKPITEEEAKRAGTERRTRFTGTAFKEKIVDGKLFNKAALNVARRWKEEGGENTKALGSYMYNLLSGKAMSYDELMKKVYRDITAVQNNSN